MTELTKVKKITLNYSDINSHEFKTDLFSISEMVSELRKYIKAEQLENMDTAWIMLMNYREKVGKNLLGIAELTRNSVFLSKGHVNEILKLALISNAESIVLFYHRPNKDLNPSGMEISSSRKLAEIGEMINVRLLDMILINKDSDFSMLGKSML